MDEKVKKGFTGTQEGMSQRQKDALRNELLGVSEFHHGDCIGADAEADAIAREVGVPVIVLHLPEDDSKEAYVIGMHSYLIATGGGQGAVGVGINDNGVTITTYTRPRKPYLERNHDIVDETMELIAAPKTDTETLRSGTWATVRYARKSGKPVKVLPR